LDERLEVSSNLTSGVEFKIRH